MQIYSDNDGTRAAVAQSAVHAENEKMIVKIFSGSIPEFFVIPSCYEFPYAWVNWLDFNQEAGCRCDSF